MGVIKSRIRNIIMEYYPQYFINKRWRKRFDYPINWSTPRDLNEKIQWLLVHSDISLWTKLTDKYLVRDYVKDKGLGGLLIPLIGVWESASKIDFDKLPGRFVLKCNHDSGSTIIVHNKEAINKDVIIDKLNKKLQEDYGYNGELQYRKISPHLVIAEELLAPSDTTLSTSIIDYKIWCFNGKPEFIYVIYGRTRDYMYTDVYDLEWRVHPELTIYSDHYRNGKGVVPRPLKLYEMLDAAAVLSAGFPEVRVDLYEVEGKIYFGEMTFTSMCGMMTYLSPDFLKTLGDLIDLNQINKIR